MPKFPINPSEAAFFAVILNKDLLRYITDFHPANVRACYQSGRFKDLEKIKINSGYPHNYDITKEALWAINNDNLEYFKFLSQTFGICQYSKAIGDKILEHGCVEFMEVLIDKISPQLTIFNTSSLYHPFCYNPNIQMLNLIYNKKILNRYSNDVIFSCLMSATKNGLYKIIVWAYRKNLVLDGTDLYKKAKGKGYDKIAQYIRRHDECLADGSPQW